MKLFRCFLFSVLLPISSYGAAGMYDQFVIVNTGTSSYYDIGAVTLNPDFQGASLGTFTTSGSLSLGGQGKNYKNNSSDVTGMQLFYRVWQGTASGSFSQLSYAFQSNLGTGPGPDFSVNQQWGTDVSGSNGLAFFTGNLLTGLSNGTWNLEVYSQITTNGVNAASSIANNNSTANFIATFGVVPEPSRTLFLVVGMTAMLMRRRRLG